MAQGARRHICPTPNTTQPEEKEWNTQARLQAPRTATIWGQDPNHLLTTRVDAYRPPRSTTQTTMSTLRQLHGNTCISTALREPPNAMARLHYDHPPNG